jgi:hypothetical protein
LSTFVMIGQNRQAEFQQAKADHDFTQQELELKTNTELTPRHPPAHDRATQAAHRPPHRAGEATVTALGCSPRTHGLRSSLRARSARSVHGHPAMSQESRPSITAARRALSPNPSITQCDVMPSARPPATRRTMLNYQRGGKQPGVDLAVIGEPSGEPSVTHMRLHKPAASFDSYRLNRTLATPSYVGRREGPRPHRGRQEPTWATVSPEA